MGLTGQTHWLTKQTESAQVEAELYFSFFSSIVSSISFFFFFFIFSYLLRSRAGRCRTKPRGEKRLCIHLAFATTMASAKDRNMKKWVRAKFLNHSAIPYIIVAYSVLSSSFSIHVNKRLFACNFKTWVIQYTGLIILAQLKYHSQIQC